MPDQDIRWKEVTGKSPTDTRTSVGQPRTGGPGPRGTFGTSGRMTGAGDIRQQPRDRPQESQLDKLTPGNIAKAVGKELVGMAKDVAVATAGSSVYDRIKRLREAHDQVRQGGRGALKPMKTHQKKTLLKEASQMSVPGASKDALGQSVGKKSPPEEIDRGFYRTPRSMGLPEVKDPGFYRTPRSMGLPEVKDQGFYRDSLSMKTKK